jgi:hypothetical protein
MKFEWPAKTAASSNYEWLSLERPFIFLMHALLNVAIIGEKNFMTNPLLLVVRKHIRKSSRQKFRTTKNTDKKQRVAVYQSVNLCVERVVWRYLVLVRKKGHSRANTRTLKKTRSAHFSQDTICRTNI